MYTLGYLDKIERILSRAEGRLDRWRRDYQMHNFFTGPVSRAYQIDRKRYFRLADVATGLPPMCFDYVDSR